MVVSGSAECVVELETVPVVKPAAVPWLVVVPAPPEVVAIPVVVGS